jgi:hypothetical protein
VKRGVSTTAPAAPEAKKPDVKKDKTDLSNVSGDAPALVYMIEFKGEFGRNVSVSSLRKVVEDARNLQPDFLLIKIDMDFKQFGEEYYDFYQSFDQFTQTEQMEPILRKEISSDPKWVKKPRLVMWVKKALGGPAFLPFISKDVYYTTGAIQGGIGDLGEMFGNTGDLVVREKQRSLRLGRAEGLALIGGYDPRIIRAMARREYVLSYDWVGGQPVYHEDTSGQFLLTDSGYGAEADPAMDVIFTEGNDILTLTDEIALRLGVSKGTVDTMDQLAAELGIERNYKVVSDRSKRVLDDWTKGVDNAEDQIAALFREWGRIDVGGDYEERTRARGQMIKIAKQIQSIITRYGEAINPYTIQAWPPDLKSDMAIVIDRLQQAQRMDRREP